MSCLGGIWEPGVAYQKAGVALDGLEPLDTGQQFDLFAPSVAPLVLSEKSALLTQRPGLMVSLDALSGRFSWGTVRVATAVPAPGRSAPVGSGSRAPGKARPSGARPRSRRGWKIC